MSSVKANMHFSFSSLQSKQTNKLTIVEKSQSLQKNGCLFVCSVVLMLIGSWHNYFYDHRFGGKLQMRVIASQLETTIDVLVDVEGSSFGKAKTMEAMPTIATRHAAKK